MINGLSQLLKDRKEQILANNLSQQGDALNSKLSSWLTEFANITPGPTLQGAKNIMATIHQPTDFAQAMRDVESLANERMGVSKGLQATLFAGISSTTQMDEKLDAIKVMREELSTSREITLFNRMKAVSPNNELLHRLSLALESGKSVTEFFNERKNAMLDENDKRNTIQALSIIARDYGDQLAKDLLRHNEPIEQLVARAELRTSIEEGIRNTGKRTGPPPAEVDTPFKLTR